MLGEQLDIFKQHAEDKNASKERELKRVKNLERLKRAEEFKPLLAKSIDSLLPADFKDFLPELKDYQQRLAGFKKDYREFDQNHPESESSTESAKEKRQEEKNELYWKTVFPDARDEEEYRSIAALYLKYIEVVKENDKRVFKSQKAAKVAEVKAKKLARKYSKKAKAKVETTKQDSPETKEPETNDELDSDHDYPDPYGDIYPYSRELRKRPY